MADSWAPSEVHSIKQPKATTIPTSPTSKDSWAPLPIHIMSNPAGPDVPAGDKSTLQEFGNLASGALPVAAGLGTAYLTGGTSLAIPALAVGAGAVARNYLQADYANEPAPTLPEAAGTFGWNSLLAYLTGGVANEAAGAFQGPIQSRLAAALAGGVISQGAKATEAAVRGQPAETGPVDFGKDVGTNLGFDLALSPFVKYGVSKTAAGRKAKPEMITLGEGAGKIREELGGTRQKQDAVELGAKGRTSTIDAFEQAKVIEDRQYKIFDKHRETATIDVPQVGPEVKSPVIDPATGQNIVTRAPAPPLQVEGPIYTNEATILAGKMKPKLDALLHGKEFESLPDDQKLALKQVDNLVDKLTAGTPTVGPDGKTQISLPLLSYEVAKQIKTSISQNAGSEVNKSFGEGGLVALVKALDKDIDASVAQWPTGKQAKSDLEVARNATRFKEQVWSKEIKDRMYGKNERTGETDPRVLGDSSQFFADAYSTPEKTARAMAALGPGGVKHMRQNYYDNVIGPKVFGSDYTKFNPRALIEDFQDPNSSSRTLFTAEQRNSALRFFKAAETSPGMKDPAISFQGRMLGLGAGALTRLGLYSTGAGGAVAGTAGTGARIGVEEFIHAGMDKPELFEYASRLVKIKGDSTEAKLLTKKLMRALAGSTVVVDVNGKKKKGEIQESGGIKF